MAAQPIPDASEPFVMKDGKINPIWYRYLKDLARRLAALE